MLHDYQSMYNVLVEYIQEILQVHNQDKPNARLNDVNILLIFPQTRLTRLWGLWAPSPQPQPLLSALCIIQYINDKHAHMMTLIHWSFLTRQDNSKCNLAICIYILYMHRSTVPNKYFNIFWQQHVLWELQFAIFNHCCFIISTLSSCSYRIGVWDKIKNS